MIDKIIPMIVMALMPSFAPTFSAFTPNHSGSQGNPATLETLEETRASSPAVAASLETSQGKSFKSHPVLDGYLPGTTFVYRSSNLSRGVRTITVN